MHTYAAQRVSLTPAQSSSAEHGTTIIEEGNISPRAQLHHNELTEKFAQAAGFFIKGMETG